MSTRDEDFATDAALRKGLREPFSKELLSKVDKGFGAIDTINHAVVTDRLNQIVPSWTYEIERFVEVDGADGMKHLLAVFGSMTIAGVTRYEVGEVERPSTYGDELKKAISDFIKRAAMRFGVALDLWTKEDLQSVQPSDELLEAAYEDEARQGGPLPPRQSVTPTGVGPKLPVDVRVEEEVKPDEVSAAQLDGATLESTAAADEGIGEGPSEAATVLESLSEPDAQATNEQWARLLAVSGGNKVKAVSRLNRYNKTAYTKETSLHATKAEVALAISGGA